jgi:3-hydroxyisobutyrate dehydrogenase-like beta-hydroxyacid dehydrogenase
MSVASVTVLGLGEAGSAIACDLVAAGGRVRGFDPLQAAPEGVEQAADARAAAAGADIALSTNSASVALEVAETVAPVLRRGALFADLNTSTPALKRAIAEVVGAWGVRFADVGLLRGVPGLGVRTPALVSGSGAEEFAAVFRSFGMPVTDVSTEAGVAAARKLARSVFMKGVAAALAEALAAGRRLDCEEWLRTDIAATIEDADARLLDRLVEGSRIHAVRRVEEMSSAVAMLEELDVEPRIARASEAWLRSLAASEVSQ